MRNDDNDSMKNRIAYFRKIAGMTQEQLGIVLGMQRAGVQKIEKKNIEEIFVGQLFKIAATLNRHPWELMGLDNNLGNEYDRILREEVGTLKKQISSLSDAVAKRTLLPNLSNNRKDKNPN